MVLLIMIPMKNGYFIGKINPTFSDKPKRETSIFLEIFRVESRRLRFHWAHLGRADAVAMIAAGDAGDATRAKVPGPVGSCGSSGISMDSQVEFLHDISKYLYHFNIDIFIIFIIIYIFYMLMMLIGMDGVPF